MNLEQARFNMIEQQIRPWDVLDPDVLSLLSTVHREDFIPQAHRAQAFMDLEIPLGEGRLLLPPRVEARMVQSLDLGKRDVVLLIGAATGFVAALLAKLAQRVIALESREDLAQAARHNLRAAGINNAEVIVSDGTQGHAAQAPYDAILLTGSVAQVPQTLLDQLKVNGRLLAVVGQEPVMQATLLTRVSQSQFSRQELFDTVTPRQAGFSQPSRFHF